MSGELVQKVFEDHVELMDFLRERGELSFLATMESSLPKVVLLASASDLEAQVGRTILDYFSLTTGAAEFAVSFVKNKAVDRQFHTYFNWKDQSANQFFGLFGPRFREKAKAAVAADDALGRSIRAFCEIGALRNQLVHQSYASFTVEKTAEEIFELYNTALVFVSML